MMATMINLIMINTDDVVVEPDGGEGDEGEVARGGKIPSLYSSHHHKF